MKIINQKAALQALGRIREHQAIANKSISPLTQAAEAKKGVDIAIDLIEYLITSGDAKESING
ncbi:hypothetical protein AB4189_05460 [Vibrio sp. 10N.286.49.E1]|uniref:hypothetical protein n=1 Tax=Vibrio sp. 10N.286.49.E1 TaxID=3229702 RepID=UPI00354D70AE